MENSQIDGITYEFKYCRAEYEIINDGVHHSGVVYFDGYQDAYDAVMADIDLDPADKVTFVPQKASLNIEYCDFTLGVGEIDRIFHNDRPAFPPADDEYEEAEYEA